MPQLLQEPFFVEPLLYRTLHNIDHTMVAAHEELRGCLPGNSQKYRRRETYTEGTYQVTLPMPYGHFKLIRDEDNRATLAAEVMHVSGWKRDSESPAFFEVLEFDGNRLRLSRDKRKYDYTDIIPELLSLEGDFSVMDADELVRDMFVTNWFDADSNSKRWVYPETAFGTAEFCAAKFNMLMHPADPMMNRQWGRTGHMPRCLLYDSVASELASLFPA